MAFIIPEDYIKKAIINAAQDQKCIELHAGSCTLKALQQLKLGTRSIAPLYFVIHLIPMLLKYKKVARNPVQQIKKFLKGFLKSLLFVASTLFTIRRGICFATEFYKYTNYSVCLFIWLNLWFPSHAVVSWQTNRDGSIYSKQKCRTTLLHFEKKIPKIVRALWLMLAFRNLCRNPLIFLHEPQKLFQIDLSENFRSLLCRHLILKTHHLIHLVKLFDVNFTGIFASILYNSNYVLNIHLHSIIHTESYPQPSRERNM